MKVRLYAPKDIIEDQTDFGLDVAVRALEYFENYFNISYPLEKEGYLFFWSASLIFLYKNIHSF